MNVRDRHLVMKMLNVPTQLGPSLVPAMKDTVETEWLAQVRTLMLKMLTCVCVPLYIFHAYCYWKHWQMPLWLRHLIPLHSRQLFPVGVSGLYLLRPRLMYVATRVFHCRLHLHCRGLGLTVCLCQTFPYLPRSWESSPYRFTAVISYYISCCIMKPYIKGK